MKRENSVRIPGLTGICHPLWAERLKGLCDGKTQVRRVEFGYSTPYIERIYSCYCAALNKAYCRTIDEMASIFSDVAHDTQELMNRDNQGDTPGESLSGEALRREAAAVTAQMKKRRQREQELYIHLHELKEQLIVQDEKMSHWYWQMDAVVRQRLSCYWGGILKAAKDEQMPPFPILKEKEIPGQALFRRQVDEALVQIAKALMIDEKEAA